MSTLTPAAPLPPQPSSEKTEYDHGSLRIREKTLVIGNSIYPISNISTVSFSDLRTPVPNIVWLLLALGVACLPMGAVVRGIGFLLLIGAVYFFMVYFNSKSDADFALSVRMNGGNTVLVTSDDGAFLKAIALELYEVIELEKASNTTFNIDQKVMIDSITGATVRIAGMQGDIVNNVPV
ncbi:MAG TPA: DUF6232 family protein [Longimicrobium sp.]|nr:DUF6232 family protein [Longimicrobium sp.]